MSKTKILLLPPFSSGGILSGAIVALNIFSKLNSFYDFSILLDKPNLDQMQNKLLTSFKIKPVSRTKLKIFFTLIKAIKVSKQNNFIICYSDYFYSVLFSYIVSLISGRKLIIMIHIFNNFASHKLIYKIAFNHSIALLVLKNEETLVKISPYIRGKEMYIFENGIEDYFLNQFKENHNNYEYLCIFIGRLEQRKGLEYMKKIYLKLAKKLPNSKLLIMYGASKEEAVCEIKEYFSNNGIINNIILVGMVSRETLVNNYIDRSKVCVVTSLYEGFSLSIAEVIARGVPVVCFDLPFTKLLGDAIIKVPFPDTDAFVETIVRLDKEGFPDSERKRIRKFALENFSFERAAKIMHSNLNECLK